MNQEAVMKVLIKFDDTLNKQVSNLLETIFNEPIQIHIDDTKIFSIDEIRSLVGDQAIRVDTVIPKKNKGITFMANGDLLPELTKYLKSSGNTSAKIPDSMQLLMDVAEQVTMIKKQCFAEILNKEVDFNSPSISIWDGKVELAFNESVVTIYEVKIGKQITFNFIRIIPPVLATEYFEASLLDNHGNIEHNDFEEFSDTQDNIDAQQSIDFIHDLELLVTVELGRVTMTLKDMLALGPGSIVELNKFAGEPVEVYVNNKKFAEGEVVVIDQNFAVRITSLIAKRDRFASLRV